MAHKGKKVIKTIEYVHVYSKADAPLKLNPQYISTTWEDAFDRHTSYLVKDKSSPDNIQQWKSIPLRKAISQAGVNTRNQEELLKYLISNAHLIFQTAANKNANYPKEPRGVFQEVDGTLILNGREVDFASNKIREIDGVASPVAIVGDIWTDIGINNVFQEGGDDIDLPFGKKPEMLLERLIRTFTEENDLVMDFFAGTGTTACVAHKLSRKWLAVEQLDYIETLTLPRLRNVLEGDKTGVSKSADWQGGGEFIYCELAKWNELAKEAIESSESLAALVTLFDELYEKYFLNYNLRLNEFKEVVMQEEGFKSLSLDEQKEMFLTMLDLNQMYVQKSEMADSKYGITEADQAVTKSFYGENE